MVNASCRCCLKTNCSEMMCYSLHAFIFLLYFAEVSTSSQRPSEREDVMGTYLLMNRYQCERLCWYRKLCKTFSYIYNRTLVTDGNCVLHADKISTNTTSAVSTAWVEREAFWESTLQYNGCRNRCCSDTQVCVPIFDSPFYSCMPFLAECQAPSRDDGVYSDVTLVHGQRTNFTCSPSLVWTPRHADKTVTCQVNGEYSGLKGTCKNTTYYSPSTPFNKPLPDVAEGWEACIKGTFTTTGTTLTRMVFNFQDAQTGSCDSSAANGGNVYLSLDFRNDFNGIQHNVVWFRTLNNCKWYIPQNAVGDLPLNCDDYFEITLRILTNNIMEIIFKNHTTLQFDLASNNVNLTGATYLEIIRDVSLSYVNLARGCD